MHDPIRLAVLLSGGLIAGPLFIGASYAQVLTRAGFDLERHAISMLSLGDLGWIQVTDFIGCGLLILALAVGIRRALHPGPAATWGPLLVGAYGVGLVADIQWARGTGDNGRAPCRGHTILPYFRGCPLRRPEYRGSTMTDIPPEADALEQLRNEVLKHRLFATP